MTIINANHYLEQLLAPAALERIARLCKFCLRQRAITPAMCIFRPIMNTNSDST